jgi:RNA polymerase sigma-70 factor (ECF subfamily)
MLITQPASTHAASAANPETRTPDIRIHPPWAVGSPLLSQFGAAGEKGDQNAGPAVSADDAEQNELRSARAGEPGGMRALYERHAARLFRSVLMPVLRDRAAAEDALRETFLSALEAVKTFEGDSALPWLARIARNKAFDALRATGARERLAGQVAAEPLPEAAPLEDVVADLEERERARGRIEAVLSRMLPRYARAVRLRLLEEQERAECARVMGVTVGAFDVLFFRACKAFRTLYVQQYGAAP